ncbi:MAG: hypothetical protein ACR2KG_00665 [Nocardioidaceae bacterium]
MSGPTPYPPQQPPPPQQAPDQFYVQQMGQESGPYRYADLQVMALNGTLRADQPVRRVDTNWFPAAQAGARHSRVSAGQEECEDIFWVSGVMS